MGSHSHLVKVLSVNIIFLQFIHVVEHNSTSFLLRTEKKSHCMYIPHAAYPFISLWTFSSLWQLLIMLLWTFMHKFCMDIYFYSVGYIPRGEIAASLFNFMRHCQAVFHSSCTILYSPQQCTRVPIFPHPHQHSLSIILITAILVGLKWYLTIVLIFISQMPNDVKLLAYWPFVYFLWRNVYSNFSIHF